MTSTLRSMQTGCRALAVAAASLMVPLLADKGGLGDRGMDMGTAAFADAMALWHLGDTQDTAGGRHLTAVAPSRGL